MDQGHWERVRSVFDSAQSLPNTQQSEFLDQSCGDDRRLRLEVEQLLQHFNQAGQFLAPDTTAPARLLQTANIVSNRYRILAHIGSGGMGDVYEAEDQDLREVVALKVFAVDADGAHGTLEHLKREIRHARRIVNPHVCRHFDFGYDAAPGGAIAYLTMERVHGDPFPAYLKRRGRLSAAEALNLAAQLCSAIGAAHGQGIVHGDLKPDNIVFAESENRLVILDFGLSRHNAQEGAVASTLSRQVAGTPSYLAPERYEGTPASFASDIYSLGVILHEIIAGKLPSTSRDLEGHRVMDAYIPRRWAAAITACLALNQAARPADAAQVLQMLAPPPAGLPRRRHLQLAWPAAAIAMAAAVWLTGMYVRHRPADQAATAMPSLSGDQPLSPQDFFRAGAAYLDRRTPASSDHAIQAFQQGLEGAPNDPIGNAGLARALVQKFDLTKSQIFLQQAASSLALAQHWAPGLPEVLLVQALIARAHGESGTAINALRKIIAQDPKNSEAWRQLARTYYQGGNILAAQEAYEEGLKQNSSYWGLYSELGWFYYTQGRYDQAERMLLAARALAPDQPSVFGNLGGVYLALGNLHEAETTLVQALSLEPSSGVAANLGTVYFDLGQFAAATKLYRQACALGPNNQLLWANLGDALAQDGKKAEAHAAYAHAVTLARESLVLSPENAQTFGSLALSLAKQGLFDDARQNEAQALRIAPHDVTLLMRATIADELSGDRQAALDHLQEALEAGASIQTVETTYELDDLRKDPHYALISDQWSQSQPR